ncbi:hypothetical protein ACFOY8_12220 [Thalassospira xianhensis]|uniref:Uncharacterized protein n=1 Tax=Thalassospira xianhensis MCCC 1A02616 TaxID=1177929 RepID=A0A367UDQ9_9PROT|nr:hypothetical protein [Thalassospira xianhensis]RCK06368.1 hypothetical protein TH5_09230 [Thalassospira xianhensis MCCC 1A02616]
MKSLPALLFTWLLSASVFPGWALADESETCKAKTVIALKMLVLYETSDVVSTFTADQIDSAVSWCDGLVFLPEYKGCYSRLPEIRDLLLAGEGLKAKEIASEILPTCDAAGRVEAKEKSI